MKTKLSAILSSLAAVAVMSFSQSAAANTCSSAGMNVVRNFCYDSGFPIRIMGRTVVAGGDVPAPPGVTQNRPVNAVKSLMWFTATHAACGCRHGWWKSCVIRAARQFMATPSNPCWSKWPNLPEPAKNKASPKGAAMLPAAVTTPDSGITTVGYFRFTTFTAGRRAALPVAVSWKPPWHNRPGRNATRST